MGPPPLWNGRGSSRPPRGWGRWSRPEDSFPRLSPDPRTFASLASVEAAAPASGFAAPNLARSLSTSARWTCQAWRKREWAGMRSSTSGLTPPARATSPTVASDRIAKGRSCVGGISPQHSSSLWHPSERVAGAPPDGRVPLTAVPVQPGLAAPSWWPVAAPATMSCLPRSRWGANSPRAHASEQKPREASFFGSYLPSSLSLSVNHETSPRKLFSWYPFGSGSRETALGASPGVLPNGLYVTRN